MIHSHYLKTATLEPTDISHTELLIWRILQRDFLMDLEHIYMDMKLINIKISYDNVRNSLLSLKDKKLIIEITEDDINLILVKKEMKEIEQKVISYSCDWSLG